MAEDAEVEKRTQFLSCLVMAFKEQMHTDVLLKPGDDGPAIPAHKAVLAAKSKVFKNMLDSDECKALTKDPITFPDLNTKELKTLIEFLYSGTLNVAYKDIRALYTAADKYDISYLQECCRNHFFKSMCLSTVLDVLELSEIHSDNVLKGAAMDFVVKHIGQVVLPIKFEGFALRNPGLVVQIMRAYVLKREGVAAQVPPLFGRRA